jgi:hypothetical protein
VVLALSLVGITVSLRIEVCSVYWEHIAGDKGWGLGRLHRGDGIKAATLRI